MFGGPDGDGRSIPTGLLDGVDYPHVTGANVTHRRAEKATVTKPEELQLFGRAAEPVEGYE